MRLGIDISYHNGNIDWQAVKNAGISFVMARCGYGPKTKWECTLDETFFRNVEQAHKYDLEVGAYFYSYALNPDEARQEGEWVYNLITSSGIGLEKFLAFDLEDADRFKYNQNFDFSKRNCTAICKAFLDAVKPLNAGIYASYSWLVDYIDWKSLGCAVWNAAWLPGKNPDVYNNLHKNPLPTYMWQYTDKLIINGKQFDGNLLYI